MARQKGPQPLSGTLQDITFYKTAESGYLARMKSSLDAKRVKKDPAFAGSRKASEEFGRASAAARLLRHTMHSAGHELSDTRIISRLTGKLTGIIATDAQHQKGQRQPDSADLSGLIGFEWNKHRSFSSLCRVQPGFKLDAAAGVVEAALPALYSGSFDAPKGATHFELVMQGAVCRFSEQKASPISDSTGWRRLDAGMRARTLMDAVTITDGQRIIIGTGLRFGREENGAVVPLLDKSAVGFVIGWVW